MAGGGVTFEEAMSGVAGATSAVSALAVLVGGGWAYSKFFREQPFDPRCNLGLQAEVLNVGGNDFLKIEVTATAVGKGRLTLVKDDAEPLVMVHSVTELECDGRSDWDSLDADQVVAIFEQDDTIEAGETAVAEVLLKLRARPTTTLAYRVRVLLPAKWGRRAPCSWETSKTVPVILLPGPSGQGVPS